MSDGTEGTEPPENWADYIDRLRVFEPPTMRLKRAQKRLDDEALERQLTADRKRQDLEIVERPEAVRLPGAIR
jgi:hypothetical protein